MTGWPSGPRLVSRSGNAGSTEHVVKTAFTSLSDPPKSAH